MSTIDVRRGEYTQIPFVITDAALGLLGKRVTWSVAVKAGDPRLLRKASGLGASSAEVTITTQTNATIVGTINVLAADWDLLPNNRYYATLWVDDGAAGDRCVTANGVDTLNIINDVARPA